MRHGQLQFLGISTCIIIAAFLAAFGAHRLLDTDRIDIDEDYNPHQSGITITLPSSNQLIHEINYFIANKSSDKNLPPRVQQALKHSDTREKLEAYLAVTLEALDEVQP